MNFKTRPVNREEFFKIIETLTTGYTTSDGRKVRPNIPVAFAITLEGNLGIRISDIVELTLSDIKFEGGRYHLDIYEKKTDKHRIFTVPQSTYIYIQNYALNNAIKPTQRLVPLSTRAVQAALKMCCEYLGLKDISTHSFRKFMAISIYNQNKDIELVRSILQHASYSSTRAYISCEPKVIEDALNQHIALPNIPLSQA